MGEACDAHIILFVDAQHLGKRLGRVLLSLEGEFLGTRAQIGVKDALQAHFPLRGQLGAVAFGDGFHIGLQRGKELGEVGQRVANHRPGTRHSLLGADAVTVNDFEHIVGRATLRETAVAVHTHVIFSTIDIVLAGHKHLAQVIHLARLAQQFGLNIADGRIGPARAAAVLVLHGSDGVFQHCREYNLVCCLASKSTSQAHHQSYSDLFHIMVYLASMLGRMVFSPLLGKTGAALIVYSSFFLKPLNDDVAGGHG